MGSDFEATLAIIAGGHATRLGGVPKGLLELEGRTLLQRQLDLSPLFQDVLLVTGDPAPYAASGLATVPDAIPGRGAPGGVHAALLRARTPWVFALACDMPFVTREVVEGLLAARDGEVDAVCFEVAGRLEPLMAVYRTSLAATWGELLRDHSPSLRSLLAQCRARVLPEKRLRALDPSVRSVVSVNSRAELEAVGVRWPAGWAPGENDGSP